MHFVDEEFDAGPIVAQWPVRVLPDDTAATLAARVLEVEHALYPRVLDAVASGTIRLDDSGKVVGSIVDATHAHFAPVIALPATFPEEHQ